MVDYQKFTTKDMPKDERDRLFVGDIWSNSIRCNICKDVIRSKNKNDFVMCSCGECFVDGGSHYLRRGGLNFEDLSELYDDVKGT